MTVTILSTMMVIAVIATTAVSSTINDDSRASQNHQLPTEVTRAYLTDNRRVSTKDYPLPHEATKDLKKSRRNKNVSKEAHHQQFTNNISPISTASFDDASVNAPAPLGEASVSAPPPPMPAKPTPPPTRIL
mmetsp:Transcript_28471/g.40543  ORF Transcript_28471/g.40543 Transcript_28471/m.40543 type:complete len:132 (+) Transcript_28471:69-464(+)